MANLSIFMEQYQEIKGAFATFSNWCFLKLFLEMKMVL